MSGATLAFTILPVSAIVALLLTIPGAYFLGRHSKKKLQATLVAGLALPTLMMALTFYSVVTDEPDGPPPGSVLEGVMTVVAIITPITLIVSWLTVRLTPR